MYGILNFLVLDGMPADAAEAAKEAASWLEAMTPVFIDFGKKFIAALIFFMVGKRVIKWLKNILKKSFIRANMDVGVEKFLISLIGICLNIVLLVVVISILGVETSSLAAMVGSAGITLGLALQGSLSNFAGGVLILVMKPFHIGDYIITNGMEGCVTGIDIFYTKLLTGDNRKVVIPNGGLSNSNIINVTNEEVRRLDLAIRVAYDSNVPKVKALLTDIIKEEPLILEERSVNIYVSDFLDNGISMGIQVWVRKEDYLILKWSLLEKIKESFDENKIIIPSNQLNVTINERCT